MAGHLLLNADHRKTFIRCPFDLQGKIKLKYLPFGFHCINCTLIVPQSDRQDIAFYMRGVFGQKTIKFEIDRTLGFKSSGDGFVVQYNGRLSNDDSLTTVRSNGGKLDAPGA
ncbi:hypothetical protein ElyMa_005846000 [Elysia marginata]|uniref:Uncharacterized protein n=1 Tax=Elysia marginata TaxID=1093978 RepID=A0AAV4FZ79_9GAST|nr:hypothetical protein ElyMa_005846000 [Elysia marginata]